MKQLFLFAAGLSLTACATTPSESLSPDDDASSGPRDGDHGTTRIRRGDGSIHEVRYVVRHGHMMWQGDIDLGPAPAHAHERSLAIKGMDNRWPDGIIDWQFAAGSVVPQAAIRAAIATYEAQTPLRFHEGIRANRPHITFSDSNDSGVSYTTGIGPDGIDGGDDTDVHVWKTHPAWVVQHELGHAIGLDHEAERSDRDQFITFDSSCSTDDSQFSTDGSSYELLGSYDLSSIMQYGSANFCEQADPGDFHTAQGNCTCYPIVRKGTMNTAENGFITQPSAFSPGDLRAIQRMYEPKLGATTLGDKFGTVLARGDFNGDGFLDLAVGVPGKLSNQGAVDLYMGTEVGLVAWKQLDLGALGTQVGGDHFGAAVTAADFDGDGFDDLIVGAPQKNGGGAIVSGVVYAYFGGKGGPMPAAGKYLTQAMLASVDELGDEFGASLLGVNLQGDGHPELVIGAPGKKVTGVRTGIVYLAKVNAATRTFSSWRFLVEPSPSADGDRFGHALAAADFDHDGIQDLAVGAPATASSTKPGTVFVYTYLANALAGAWAIHDATRGGESAAAGDQFGTALAVGNFDGASYPNTQARMRELVIGAPGKNTPTDSGRIFTSRPYYDGFDTFSGFTQTGMFGQTAFAGGVNGAGDSLGVSVAVADFDGDGFDDVVAGAPLRDNGASLLDAGAVLLFRGGAAPVLTGGAVYNENPFSGTSSYDQLGASVVTGDFNHDGAVDFIGGAANHTIPGTFTIGGAFYDFSGTGGLPLIFGQFYDQTSQSAE